jgi:hypothetical protein
MGWCKERQQEKQREAGDPEYSCFHHIRPLQRAAKWRITKLLGTRAMLRHTPGQTADLYLRTTISGEATYARLGAAERPAWRSCRRCCGRADARLPHPSHRRNGVAGDLVSRDGKAQQIKASHGAWPRGPRPLLCHNEPNTKGLPALIHG